MAFRGEHVSPVEKVVTQYKIAISFMKDPTTPVRFSDEMINRFLDDTRRQIRAAKREYVEEDLDPSIQEELDILRQELRMAIERAASPRE